MTLLFLATFWMGSALAGLEIEPGVEAELPRRASTLEISVPKKSKTKSTTAPEVSQRHDHDHQAMIKAFTLPLPADLRSRSKNIPRGESALITTGLNGKVLLKRGRETLTIERSTEIREGDEIQTHGSIGSGIRLLSTLMEIELIRGTVIKVIRTGRKKGAPEFELRYGSVELQYYGQEKGESDPLIIHLPRGKFLLADGQAYAHVSKDMISFQRESQGLNHYLDPQDLAHLSQSSNVFAQVASLSGRHFYQSTTKSSQKADVMYLQSGDVLRSIGGAVDPIPTAAGSSEIQALARTLGFE